MKKRINELLNGKFEYLQETLELSETRICGKTMERENFCGRFSIVSSSERSIQGFIQSTNLRVGVKPDSFSGSGETVRYEADVKGLSAGDVLTGEFILNTTAGEYRLPYEIQIEKHLDERQSAEPLSMTAEEFAAMAKEDFAKAYVLFVSAEFRNLTDSWSAQCRLLYDGLMAEGASYRCLEQFLVGIEKKEPIVLETDTDHLLLERVTETRKEELILRKNTWGFAALKISCDADFLELERTQVTTEEFVGSICHIGFVIHKERLHAGKQFAKICVSSGLQELTCLVEVRCENRRRAEMTQPCQKKAIVRMLTSYIDYRTQKCTPGEWKKETLKALEIYRQAGGKEIFFDLYESYVLFLEGDSVQAELLLGQVQERKEELKDPGWQGCYLYLTGIQNQTADYQDYIKTKIAELYLENQDSWILQWLMFRVNGQLYRNDAEKLEEIRKKYQQGCHNPVLYLDAWDILKKEPLMLRRLEEFEIQLLAFLCREKIFDSEISGQAAQLAGRIQWFHPVLFRVLTSCYEQTPTKNLLFAICRMLMEGRKKEKKYARWFTKGVMEDLRITGLYEYFVETADHLDTLELPKAIRLYFVYHNTLDSVRKAAIYASIIRNREKDPETYGSYRKVMELFMEEQLAEGKISRDLALMYETLLSEEVMTEQLAAGLEKALFAYEVSCENTQMKNLIVLHRALDQESRIAFHEGKAIIQILNKEHILLAEDSMGRRYAAEPFCQMKQVMNSSRLENLCRKHLHRKIRLLIHDCMTVGNTLRMEEGQLEKYLQLLPIRVIRESYRTELRQKLLTYFAKHPDHPGAEEFLRQIDIKEMAQNQMKEMARLLSGLDRYEELYQLICEFGPEKAELEILVYMCSYLLSEKENAQEERMLLAVCAYCFEHGLYDEKMLLFLMRHYDGSLELMKKLWYTARDFKLESFELEERILVLVLFLGQGEENTEPVFHSYEKKMGKSIICRAYVTWMSYQSFVKEKKADWSVFSYIERTMLGIVGTPDVCKLALLKRYTERKEKSAGQQKWMLYLLEKYLRQGMRFSFMMKLPKKLKEKYHLYDKYILEYRTVPGQKVILHYCYQDQEEKSVCMKEMFEGIYTKEFTMFYQDTLKWYVTLEDGTESEPCYHTCQSTFSVHGVTRYDLINQMIQAQEQKSEEKQRETRERYTSQQYLAEEIFRLN